MNPNEEFFPEAQIPQPETPVIPEPEYEPVAEIVTEAPAEEIPVAEAPAEEPAPQTVYRSAGAGRKESPYANSPYESPYTNAPYTNAPYTNAPYANTWQEQPAPRKPKKVKKVKKARKPLSGGVKKAVAAILAVAVLLGGCGLTAALVGEFWEERMDRMEDTFEDRLEQLEKELEKQSAIQSGSSVSGSPAAADGSLTPSQVYAMNVNSVVSIENTLQGGVSSGTGFILSEDGYVITNHHVIEGGGSITVTTYMGDEYAAKIIGSDDVNDVALLKVEATGLDAVEVGSSDDLLVGDQVVAIGNALGELASTQTVGYISGKDRSVTTDGSIINMLQTDAAINSGNSGGPLFNMKGQVVGITSAKYSGNSSSGAAIEGIGFAIPMDDVMGMIQDFMDYGYLKNQAYLGVIVRDMDTTVASQYSLPSGSYVDSVTEGGSAHRAGVQAKDIIVAVGEYQVSSNAELTNALRRFKAGDTTTITVYRAGAELVLDITFDERPQEVPSVEETQPSTLPGEMPQDGNYEDWFDYFSPFFGFGG